MTPEGWRQIEELFEAALELEGPDRARFLHDVRERDETAGAELQRLLAEHEQAGSFLEQPVPFDLTAAPPGPSTDSQAPADGFADLSGQRIGPYRILREVGLGGMGAVYLAERADGQFRSQVAIKLIRRGFSSEAIVRRFRNERQVLAALKHPNIARLIDGGVTGDGLPYLVMDYVEGDRIDDWCDEHKLRIPDRLRLFRKICDAVQYAHDQQVIHRDLKPSNILVTANGSPQLLDFGIAKVLNPELRAETMETTAVPGPMTPDYASPEQVRGENVLPASDVYALGMLLYRLLTGRHAYAVSADLQHMARVICEQEPVKPSATDLSALTQVVGETSSGLRHLLAGDLDNIVLRALRKEPERRYESVAEFSADVGRFLEDQPVRARKDSLAYRTGKFLRRYRTPTITAILTAVLVLSVSFGLTRFTWLYNSILGRMAALGSGASPTTAKTDRPWDRLKFEKIAALGDPAPGGGVYTRYFQPWALNNNGDVTFASQVAPGGEAVFLLTRGAASPLPLARPGDPAPGGGRFQGELGGSAALNDAGDVAFVTHLDPVTVPELKGFAKAGLYSYSHVDRKLRVLVVPGVTPAPGGGVFHSANDGASLNKSGEIVFSGVVRSAKGVRPADGLGQGIFFWSSDNQFEKVVLPGDAAPGRRTFDHTYNPWINDRGDIAFEAHVANDECIHPVAGGGTDVATPPGCAGSVYLKSVATGAIESIAHQDDQAPHGWRYYFAWGPVLNNTGDVLFIGARRAANAPSSIHLHSRGVTSKIADPGDIMPDGRRIVTVNPSANIGNYSMNNQGDIGFVATLEQGESAFYVRSRGDIHLIAGTGTVIPGIGTIQSVTNFLVNGGIVNDRGQVFFWATMKDGKGVLLLGTPQPPLSR